MSEPKPSLLELLERRRKGENFLQSNRDGRFQDSFVVEYVELYGAAIHFFPKASTRDPSTAPHTAAGVDPLDGDVLDIVFVDTKDGLEVPPGNRVPRDRVKFNIRAIVDHEPSKQLLTKFGITEKREIVFHIPFQTLVKLDLVDDRRFRGGEIGDLIEWDGTWYRADAVHRTEYFAQTDRFHYTAFFCNRYYHNSHPEDHSGDRVPCTAPLDSDPNP